MIKKFDDYGIDFRIEEESDKITISMYDNDKKIGYSIIKRIDGIFKNWNINSYDFIENPIETNKPILYIFGISIINKKLGWGEKMIRFIEEFAKENGFEYIALSSTTEAFGFWRKMGYKIYSSDEFIKMYKKI